MLFAGRQVFLISPQVLLQVLLVCPPPTKIPVRHLLVLLLLFALSAPDPSDTIRTLRHSAPARGRPPIPTSAAAAGSSLLPDRRRVVVALPPMPWSVPAPV